MPTSSGPCRFGQYSPLLKKILKELGYSDAVVFSPTSSDGYEGFGGNINWFLRTSWRAVVTADILRKFLYMIRPYEKEHGTADVIHLNTIKKAGEILSNPGLSLKVQIRRLQGVIEDVRDEYKRLLLKDDPGTYPLIGIVGEIYLRFNDFSNQYLIRNLEKIGGEAWIADIGEWVWYTNYEEKRKLRESGKKYSYRMMKSYLRSFIQEWDQNALLKPVNDFFVERREAQTEEILSCSEEFLPAKMALGEMTLNAGKAISFFKEGCDGVIDISPFTCMNGIVTEVVYPDISKACKKFPIKIFYFDGVQTDLESDLEIFMEQVKIYRKKRLKM